MKKEKRVSSNKILSKKDKDFYGFVAFCVHEWARMHCVLISPRMIEIMGTDILEYKGEWKPDDK